MPILRTGFAERLTAVPGQHGRLPAPRRQTQVTIEYDGDKAVRLDTVVVSDAACGRDLPDDLLAPDIEQQVIAPVLAELAEAGQHLDISGYRTLINPTGKFVIGGPMGARA